MPNKRCSWGICNSDSRYEDRQHMTGVYFIPFPKPTTQINKWTGSSRTHIKCEVRKCESAKISNV